jgi:phage FluMu protein Com
MNTHGRRLTRRGWLALGLAALLAPTAGSLRAHEAKCPHCKLDVVQDTPQQDNEVALKFGRKRIEYRCVYCAVVQARAEFKGDLTILAPSELKTKPVTLTRKGEAWTATPPTAAFVAVKAEKPAHERCAVTYRAFTTAAAAGAYLAKHRAVLGEGQPLSLAQFLEIAK